MAKSKKIKSTSEEPKVAPVNYDSVEADGSVVTSKSERKSDKRGSSYQGNPTDPFSNTVGDKTEAKKKDTNKKKKAPKEKDLNKKKRPEPTPDLEDTSNREDG